MALTSFAVVGFFRRTPSGNGPWTTTVAPLLAGVALTVLFALIVINFDVLIGLAEPGVLSWLLPAIIVVPGIAGVAGAYWLRSARPGIYAGIGRGGSDPDELD